MCTQQRTNALLNEPMLEPVAFLSTLAAATNTPAHVKLDILAQPEIRVNVEKVSVHNDSGRQTSDLSYTVNNKTGESLKSLALLLTFFNDRNEPLGGEIIRAGESCRSSSHSELNIEGSKQLRSSLAHYVSDGQRVALAVFSYATNTRSWTSNQESVVKEMKVAKE